MSDAIVRWDAAVERGELGSAIAVDGDVDGDKTPDVLMGAQYTVVDATSWGCAYLQLGLATGTIDVSTLRSFPATSFDGTGAAVAFVPDWAGDESSELAFGEPYAGGTTLWAGAVRVVFSEAFLP